MAVTRIKNNQITDATIIASAKLTDFSVTAGKLANNITYGSDLTISGNLTVNGQTTTIDSTTTTIEDPVILLASTQTGNPTVDIGYIGERGTSQNIAFVWKESASEFVTAFTNDAVTNTTITIASYANFHTNDANVGGNLVVGGNISITGNIASLNVSGNITGGNLLTPGLISATSTITSGANITGANVLTGGLVSATGTVTGGNLATGGTASAGGNITGANILTGGLVSATSTITSGANITGANILTGGLVSATGTVTGGNIATGGTVSAGGNVTGANILTGGLISATSTITSSANITGGNILTGGEVSAVGNITANTGSFFIGNGSQLTGVTATSAGFPITAGTSNIAAAVNGNIGITVGGTSNVAVFATSGEYVTGVISANGNVTGGNLITAGNVYTPSIIQNAGFYDVRIQLDSPSGIIQANTNGNVTQFLPGGQIRLAPGGAKTILSGTLDGSQIVLGTAQTDLVQNRGGNVTVQVGTGGTTANTWTFAQDGNLYAPGAVSAVGNITGGNVLTGGLISATANITGGNLNATGLSLSGNVVSPLNVTGNITGANILTGGLVSATGNVTGGNVNTSQVFSTSALTLTNTTGNINLTTAGNVVLNNTYLTGLQLNPVNNTDAASKYYVDLVATTGIAYHEAVVAATTTTLATATGGTVTYTQPNGAGNGVGALLTTTGAFNLIDTANVQTLGTRILVKNEANAVFNGVYTWANATNIIRSTDTDQYGPNSAEEFSVNDYFFVTSGFTNSGSAWVVDSPTGVITFGTSNIAFAQFSSSQTYTAGNGISIAGTVISAKVDNNTTAFDGTGNIIVKAGANLTTPNIGAATGTSLSVSGNVNGGNVLTGGLVSATGTITGGNLATGGTVSATATITGGNLATGGTVSATGTVTGGNLLTGGLVSATSTITSGANITGANLLTGGLVSATSTITSGANITGANLLTGGLISATATITGGNLATGGTVSATGNITGGNLLTGGSGGAISGTGNITGGNILTGGQVSAIGNITANTGSFFIGNGSQLTGVTATSAGFPITAGNSNIAATTNGNIFVTVGGTSNVVVFATSGEYVTGVISANGTVTGGNLATGGTVSATGTVTGGNLETGGTASVTGNITGGNVLTGGLVSATGNVNGGNVVSSALVQGVTVSASGNVIGGNVTTGGLVSATGTITGGNLATGGTVSATATITGGNLATGGTASVTGNITGGNILTGGLISATGNVNGGNLVSGANLTITGGNIFSTASAITVNGASGDVNFAVNGDTTTVFFVDAGTETASFGNSTQTTNAIVAFNATNSILFPVGNTAQRPATGVTGMVRFNTTNNNMELYDNSAWTAVGVPSFTVIADEQFNGDGANVNFTLGSSQTTNSCIVSINGVVQVPTVAYSVSGTFPTCVLTFTEAPASGDLIDVREITTTTTVTSISNSSGNAVIAVSATSATTTVTGDLSVSGTIIGGNINSTAITNGTSNMTVVASGGNIRGNVGGTTVMTISPGLVDIVGNLTVSGNATLSGNILGDRVQNGTTSIDIQTANGNANITVGGTSNVAVFNTAGVVITGNITNGGSNATGNIGSSTTYWNTVFAQATSALYADLAEKYTADAEYAPGTVVAFGGTHEVTLSTHDGDRRVAGVISTNPSYIMNGGLEGANIATVALTGRVPTKVTGTVAKGDLMVSNGDGTARTEADPRAGAIIGKALEDSEGDAVIEVVVGRF